MFFKALLPLVTVALQALALPSKRQTLPTPTQANVTDTDLLNFALTLELLKSAFYQGGLANFTTKNFLDAGYAPGVRGFYEQMSQYSQTYVANITSQLGNQSVQACTYDFPTQNITQNVTEFVATSDTLEAISTSAYIGSSAYTQDKGLRVTFASILATTAHQSTWVNNAVRGGNPWSTAYETPLDLNQTFTLISTYIAQCPSNNTVLPFQANPQLTTNPPNAQPGQNVTLSYSGQPSNSSGLFAAFLNGFPFTFAPLDNNFTVTIPPTLRGFAYVVVTNSSGAANDSVTVAGPAFFSFPFNANNTLITLNQ
ncbi:ferritin-like domain-containing protein [Lactarius akahatsu]|uniref:Ferritin-like domain-containing protein n=1 Tax=Lactarius akahatsu TaxID=416441 RepID=A0AAD4L3Q3_9AGAM|nr:ferritin-like domain-containing protein [Lactarius akahatsu]